MQTTVPVRIAHCTGTRTVLGSLRIVAAAAVAVSNWAAATEGRRRTERALRALDRGEWQVLRDVGVPGGERVDHVVVGPGGLYVLDSRAWRGVVTVDHKGATITPVDGTDAAWTATGRHRSLAPAAVAIVHALTTAAGRSMPAPRAVMVVWAAFPERVAISGGVTYVAGEHLARWLVEQPRRVDDRRIVASLAGARTVARPRTRTSLAREPVPAEPVSGGRRP